MSKLLIQNDIGSSVTVKYISLDDNTISMIVNSDSSKQTEKNVKPNSSVSVSNSQQSESITYESRYRTLRVYHAHQKLTLQWI